MKKLHSIATSFLLAVIFLVPMGCKKAESTSLDGEASGIYLKFANTVEVYTEGDFLVVRSDGVPNHSSPYFETTDSRYEAYNGTNSAFNLNPNRISEQSYTFRIPLDPQEDPGHEATPMGPMGVALNGVPIFNQYAAGGSDLDGEINSFDQYNGHPQQTGQYHYHIDPVYLTTGDPSALVGFLLDGYPVYGPQEPDGSVVTNDDLDEYHGHFGPTPDYPDGIYHYHITAEAPYINGDGFYGTPGTISY